MKKAIAGLFAAALFAGSALADVGGYTPASKDLMKVVEEGPYVETAKTGVALSGYVDAGYQYNSDRVLGHKPATDNNARGDFDLNALKLVLEKPLSDANELQAGFRADIMMGEDVGSVGGTNALGGASDDLFLEQAYVALRLPYGNGIDLKIGKFVTILGYEVIERPANMNISYGNLFQNMIALWHTGVIAAYQFNDIVDVQFGVTNTANDDNSIGGGLGAGGNSGDGAAVIGSINITNPGGNANWYNSFYWGIDGDDGTFAGAATDNGNVFIWDTWGQWAPKFANDKLLLAFNADLGFIDDYIGAGTNSVTWWGAALYAKYQFTDVFSLAMRGDYIHTDDPGVKFGNGAANADEDIWSYTVTASFDVIENVMLRTEYRLDWADDFINDATTTDGPAHQGTVQVVYSF